MQLRMKISTKEFNDILLKKNQSYETLSKNIGRLPVTISRLSKGAVTRFDTAEKISTILSMEISDLFESI